MTATRVIYRLTPCTCGCGGADPWHRGEFTRVITPIDESTGTVRLPMSTQPVTVRRSALTGLWIVDRDSIVFDK